MRTNIPVPRQSYQNRSHLVHKDIHWGIERDPGAGSHGQEAEPHAHVEPFTDAGTVQQLRLLCRPGGVLRRLLRRLGAATWRLGGRSAGGHGTGRPSERAGREARCPARGGHPGSYSYQAAREKRPVSASSRAPQAYTETSGAPKVLLLFPQQGAQGQTAGQAPPLLSLHPRGLGVHAAGTPGFLFQRWPPGSRRPHRLGVLRPPGGHFPTSLLCGSWEPLQPGVSPISPELEPANCWFDTEPMVVG